MSECKLSYIIPVYNGESIIQECLNSIFCQNLHITSFEVLVIDDFSTDSTYSVLCKYASTHQNMTVFKQAANHRQGAARNVGISHAKGKYITFIDADDKVEPGIEKALEYACKMNDDIVCAGVLYNSNEYPEVFNSRKLFAPADVSYPSRTFCDEYFEYRGYNGATPWGYLFKLEYIKKLNHPFVEDRQWEDNDWMGYVFYHANTISTTEEIIYRYNASNPSSTEHSLSFSKVVDKIACAVRRMQLADMVKNEDPIFAGKAFHTRDKYYYIDSELGYRRWSRFKLKDIYSFYSKLGSDNVNYLRSHYSGRKVVELLFQHKALAMVSYTLTIPVIRLINKISDNRIVNSI